MQTRILHACIAARRSIQVACTSAHASSSTDRWLVRHISALSCPRMACVKTTSLSCVAGSLRAHRAATSRRHRQRHEARAAAAGNGADNATQQQPQRGVVILPGLGNSAADYTAIAADLEVQTAVKADIGMICPCPSCAGQVRPVHVGVIPTGCGGLVDAGPGPRGGGGACVAA